jgi:hypothetical protein
MKTVGKDTEISIEEPVRIVVETKDNKDCPVEPYLIESVKVYFVSREFTDTTASTYEMIKEDSRLVREYEEARNELCAKKKDSVAAASTGELNLYGTQTVDGIGLSAGDRVLVKDQTDAKDNGIYEVSEEEWYRSDDALELVDGSYVFVDEGVANMASGWFIVASGPVRVGKDPIRFARFSENGVPSSPDQYSETKVTELRRMKAESASSSEFHYKDAFAVKVFGGSTDPESGEFFPAWLNPEMVPSELKDSTISNNILGRVYEGDGLVKGKFEVVWDPSGCREGDYFICWSWRPNLSAESMSAHLYFSMSGGVGVTASIPTHRTDPKKYSLLMDRYLPEMFKTTISDNDLSPLVLKGLNDSVAAGFTTIESLANQIIDLFDSNATHQQLLPLLSNMFALKLKSSDPTLWRRQIKKAMPNYKRKGTISGLKNAFSDAGMKLLRLSRLWQLKSDYTFQEHFVYQGETTFDLSHNIVLPLDENFQIWFRASNGQWEDMTNDAESLVAFEGSSMTWLGGIEQGDSIKVLYKIKEIPPHRQALEDYIRLLPLMDNRDERGQDYPPKNWNVRVLEEDDPMFGTLIPVRHPLADPIVWGKVRTEFPYSENAYNMDEYNGSKRDSMDPCDIDKEFVDPCSGCQASVFNLDLEVEGLSDGSFTEALQVAEEYMPFHATVHTYNLSGSKTEFMGPAEERIETFVTVSGGETLIAGEAQHIFNRDMDTRELEGFKRSVLGGFTAVENPSGGVEWHGTIKNKRVCLFSSVTSSESDLNDQESKGLTQGFGGMNINTSSMDDEPFQSGNLLELLGSTKRYHTLSSLDGSSAEIRDSVDPSEVGPLFEYRISNLIANLSVNISQTKRIIFSDEDANFYSLGIVSQKDIDDGASSGEAWRLRFEDTEYRVLDTLPDGTLLLEELSPISPISGWSLRSGGVGVADGSGGFKSVYNMGLVDVVSPPEGGVRSLVSVGDYLYFGWPDDVTMYRVKSFRSGEESFYIEGYEEGGAGGESAKLYRRVVESRVGQIGYDGILLSSDENLESSLPVSNGKNAVSSSISTENLKENYLLFVGSEYYTILEIDGTNLVLGGRLDSFTKAGQEVDFSVYRFSKAGMSLAERVEPPVPAFDFDSIDRSGKALIGVSTTELGVSALSSALNYANDGQPIDMANQRESIEVSVEYRDGEQ